MRALVLSGGGSRGSFQVGVLKYLMGDLGFRYDILCGVSVGALNCGYLSMFSDEESHGGLDKLINIWETISTDKVHKRWFPFGKLHGLWKKSFYNSTPLIDLVRRDLSLEKVRLAAKMVGVGAVSLSTGKYRTFTQNDDCFIDGVLASSSFPAFLKPIMIEGELYSDGGVKEVTPLKQAIDFGADQIDVVMCSPRYPDESFKSNDNTIDVAMRTIDLMSDEIIYNDIKIAQLYNKLISLGEFGNKRVIDIKIISPEKTLDIESLKFDHDKIMMTMALGYSEAKKQYK